MAQMTAKDTLCLFGGDAPWNANQWVASDDRVRGGKSQSHLDCPGGSSTALFHGNLDITTLGGAGFASQRTVDRSWNLSSYSGLNLEIAKSDGKKYTLTLKDETLPKRPDGREQSTVSWEYDFVCDREDVELFISWDDFKPTYRGKDKPDAKPLDLENIRRISFMMRSFFGDQEGPFRLEVKSLCATKTDEHTSYKYVKPPASSSVFSDNPDKKFSEKQSTKPSWRNWFCGLFRQNKGSVARTHRDI